MDYDVSKENLFVKKLAFEACKEIPIDLDFSLPDYCPDVQKILKCQVCPDITSRNISGDQINIEGTTKIKIIYADADSSNIRCCENSVPFSCSIGMSCSPENAIMHTRVKTEYVNCRAVSSRKLDIHGAMSICVTVYNKDSVNIPVCVSGKDIEQKVEKISVSELVGVGQQQFSVSETLEVGSDDTSPEVIVMSDSSFINNDYKIMSGKVVVKGKAMIKVLYSNDLTSDRLEAAEYEIPVSQIVDVPGVNEECECIINTETLSRSIKIQQSQEGEESSGLISVDLKVSADVLAFKSKEIDVVSDVYSRKYIAQNTSEMLQTDKIIQNLKESFSSKGSVSLSGVDAKEIIDVWANVSNIQSPSDEQNPKITGKVNLCILGRNSENAPFYVERMMDFEYMCPKDIDFENTGFETQVIPVSVGSGNVNGESVEIKVNFIIYMLLLSERKIPMVTSVIADENELADKDPEASLTLYFAKKGESLWEIARKYYSCVNSIKEENNMTSDFIDESKMILIPSKQ